MFKEITDPEQILEYSDAGLLYDSCHMRNPETGYNEWDGPLPMPPNSRPGIAELLRHRDASQYKFYIYLED